MKVWSSKIIEDSPKNIEPGKVLTTSHDCIAVKCGSGTILLMNLHDVSDIKAGDYL